ncbi:ABC-2 family transporter protein [compost metagenome]
MNSLWQAEWLRFIRNRSNLLVLLACALILTASGIWSGYSAKNLRAQVKTSTLAWQQQMATAAELSASKTAEIEPGKNAIATYNLTRNSAPSAHLPPLGGLALSASRFQTFPTSIAVGIDSRYADSRKAEAVNNPLLAALGMLDFSSISALLLPLFAIGLSYGLVQEDREQGRWRLVCAQMRKPWRLLLPALGIRLLVIVLTFAIASACAFLPDPGATLAAYGAWLLVVTAAATFWLALCGLSTLLPFSSGATAVGLIAIWIASSFVLPAALSIYANDKQAMPSRLTSITTLRMLQQETEEHSKELLSAWYAQHPHITPPQAQHSWPVSYMPRYLEQDRQLRPLMAQFDLSRSVQLQLLLERAWLSPSLLMIAAADTLAGINAERYQLYTQQLNLFEDEWRDFFVPKIMNYQAVSADDYRALPQFVFAEAQPAKGWRQYLVMVLYGTGLLLLLLFVFRQRLRTP